MRITGGHVERYPAVITPTIADTFEKFLRLSVADGDASPRTVEAYRDNMRFYAVWCSSALVDPLTATHDTILAYRASLVESHCYKRATIRLRLTAVRLLYRALQRWGGRPDNPADGIRAPKEKEGDSSAVLSKAVSPDQARALLLAAGEGRDGAMVRLMILHGLRAGEIVRLTHEDLSAQGDRLSVPGKGGKRRTLILAYRCRRDLAARPAGPLFTGRGGKALTVRSIERTVNKAMEAVGAKVAGRSCHALRHGFGVLATIGGARPEAISEAMGHVDPKTTAIYTRAAWAYMENPSDAIERALK